MKQFTAPKRRNQGQQQKQQAKVKESGSSQTQERSKQKDQVGAVENVVYFFRGEVADFDIGTFPFVRGVKVIDGVSCVFINEEYIEQHKVIRTALEQLGLEFMNELYYTRKFEEVYQKAEVFFRDLDFWRIVTGEEKNKNAEYVIKNQKKLI